ncbi:MAG: tRNA lysidine(34) synthetase TilS [Alphaproteobacteria bacterium]|nr:tRNA lysidine(34) synthetase TilS [Alphaproteobacteria bacterium]
MDLYRFFEEKLCTLGVLDGQNLAVGVSGGADSLALLHLTCRFAKNHNNNVFACCVDHGLRQNSDKEASYVSELSKKWGANPIVLKWDGEKPQTGIEKKARDMRYFLLFEACYKQKAPFLLLGHHYQDQAETFIIRQQGQSGDLGLACMSEKKSFFDGMMLRPFLGIFPQLLKDYNQQMDIKWVEDPTNHTSEFMRGRLRQNLTREEIKNAFEMASLYGEKRKKFEKKVCYFFQQYLDFRPLGFAFLPISSFDEDDVDVQSYALGEIIRIIGGKSYAPDTKRLQAICFSIKNKNFRGCTLGGCRIDVAAREKILVWKEAIDQDIDKEIKNPELFYWDRFRFSVDNYFQGWTVGATKNRFPNKNFYPKRVFQTLPVVFRNEKLFFIPKVEYKYNNLKFQGEFYSAFPLVRKPEWSVPVAI